jgi:lipoprotein-anchoring transpeptidase ErfK/SrfK
MKKFLPLIMLAVCSSPSFSLDVSRYSKDFAALGLSGAELSVTAPEVPLRGYPGLDLAALRAEAAADPDKFIDEHTPQEVGLVFGLQPSRFMITDKARIASAPLRITVDLSRQRLVVQSSGTVNEYKISSGLAPDHATPGSGKCFGPDSMEPMHYSSLYNNAPMPNTVFFNGNIAMHGTGAEALLGQPASHGCNRLSKADSKTVYDTVKAAGKANTVICVQGVTPKKQ